MRIEADSVEHYIDQLPDDRKEAFARLRKTIIDHLPPGFEEVLNYGMVGYVVPHATYPAGYHCNPQDPLPFINIASQKNFIALYHMGLYADKELLDGFVKEYPLHCKTKLDMGKSCVRFKKPDQIPFDLIGSLCEKMTVEAWVNRYEENMRASRKG